MKKYIYGLLVSGCMLSGISPADAAPGDLWVPLHSTTVPATGKERPHPENSEVISLDEADLKAALSRAGSSVNEAVQITLPAPDGKAVTFKVWNTPVMEKELQAQFPQIQTFTGVSVQNPGTYLKLSYGTMGMFISVLGKLDIPEYNVEPYSFKNNGYYAIFKTKDFVSPLLQNQQPCRPLEPAATGSTGGVKTAQRQMGIIRHKFKAAITCTGEYAQLVTESATPNINDVLSIVTATMNNVNGFWEQEIGCTTVLVNNEVSLLFTNPDTDPYNNNDNNSALLDEVQPIVDNLMGSATYDIGHIFNTAGGGIAQLLSLCGSGAKAKGVSGTSDPTDIHTIIHEMGHQISNGHTFASTTGGCSGQLMEASAWEPGSGNTIMSYNGVCTPNDLPTPVEHYNAGNLRTLNDFILLQYNSGCGTTMPAVPQTSEIEYGPIAAVYNIPAYTPFELTADEASWGVGSHAGPFYYSWEQHDLGNVDQTESQNANATEGPNFGVTPLDSSRIRVFPDYSVLAAGQYEAVGQRLTKRARTMSFITAVRGYAEDGWGAFNVSDDSIAINTIAPSNSNYFRVTAPNTTGITWEPGSSQTVTWDTSNSRLAPISCGFVNIYLSRDNGQSFPYILATNVPNTGAYTLTVPNVYSPNSRIKVKAVGNVFFDVSKVSFLINGDPLSVNNVANNKGIKVYPNPATDIAYVSIDNYNGEKYEAFLFNNLGQKIWAGSISGKESSIPLAGLASGIYYVHIQSLTGGKSFTQNIAVKK